MKAPCEHCEYRRTGCHDGCPAYMKFKAEREEINKLIRKDREYLFTGTEAFCLRRVKDERV